MCGSIWTPTTISAGLRAAFNPLGIQADGIVTEGSGTDFSVDIVMESKGLITSDGWTLEVAIPFKSLRYEAGKGKLWGLHLQRNIDRFNDEFDSWMPTRATSRGFWFRRVTSPVSKGFPPSTPSRLFPASPSQKEEAGERADG
jgi:hypothetical protein